MLFKDRYDAASQLIPHLEKYCKEQGVVLAVPRGGVPIGYEIAKYFNLPLQLLMTKKIGHPMNPEFAIGAVGLEDHLVDLTTGIPSRYIDEQVQDIRKSLKERYRRFMGDQPPVGLENKVVIITDDGIATGNTIMGSIRMMRQKRPKKIVVAVPVAPVETARKMKKYVDDFICLHVTENFRGVGQYYDDFSEVSDEEVIALIKEANRFGAVA
jgi:putative phosphoribosyl transferase